jgi:predicted acylesterase/phospholipase RssA
MVETDLMTGKKVVLKTGNIFNALRATMSIPGLFAPVKVKDRWLVDGGLVDPFPVGVARAQEADVAIAVDLNRGFVSNKNLKKLLESARFPGRPLFYTFLHLTVTNIMILWTSPRFILFLMGFDFTDNADQYCITL